jgi:hypothetical protein
MVNDRVVENGFFDNLAIYLQKIGPLKITDNVNIPSFGPASKKL